LTARAREAAIADRIYLLQDGRTREVQSGAELLTDWRALASAGIELPGVYELAGALETRGYVFPVTTSASELTDAIIGDWRSRHDDR
jgi:hypothetical protein